MISGHSANLTDLEEPEPAVEELERVDAMAETMALHIACG